MIATPNEASKLFRESIFPAMLVRSIIEKVVMEHDDATRDDVAQQIADEGFKYMIFTAVTLSDK